MDFNQHNKDIIPSNENRAIFVFIDEKVNISSAVKDKEVIELKVVKRNSIVNYLSEILTGSLPELNGLIGNKLSTKRLHRFDSILNEVKYNNYFEIGREYDAFIKNSNDTLQFTYDPIVSSDIIGSSCGALVDGLLTDVLEVDGKQLVKIVAWYDNEMGYSYQMVRTAKYLGSKE